MSDDSGKKSDELSRRGFLEIATTAVAGAGVAAATWPFIQSMNPSQDVLSKATTEVDLSPIEPGKVQTVAWQGKPVFVLHRTDEQIEKMQGTGDGKQPEADDQRAQQAKWLIVVGLCTHLGCVPSRKEDGWFCPCHGSAYDNSGRVLRGPAPSNLELPPYEFVANDKIIIGKKA